MDATAVISALGGPSSVAQRFGAARTAVCNWRHQGIPARYWLPILRAVEGDPKLSAVVTEAAVTWRPAKNAPVIIHDATNGSVSDTVGALTPSAAA